MTSVKSLCRPATADMTTFLANLTINVLTFWAGYVLVSIFDGNLSTSDFNTSQYISTDGLSTGLHDSSKFKMKCTLNAPDTLKYERKFNNQFMQWRRMLNVNTVLVMGRGNPGVYSS
jgi:hypothetical protein